REVAVLPRPYPGIQSGQSPTGLQRTLEVERLVHHEPLALERAERAGAVGEEETREGPRDVGLGRREDGVEQQPRDGGAAGCQAADLQRAVLEHVERPAQRLSIVIARDP